MAYWNWRLVRDGAIRLGLMLLSFSFVFQNISWLNAKFLPQLPVGFILLFVIGIFILRHIYKTLKWYSIWLKQKWKLENLIIHFCLYLIIFSVVLSIPLSLGNPSSLGSIDISLDNLIPSYNSTSQPQQPQINTVYEDGYSVKAINTYKFDGPKAGGVNLLFTNTGSDIEEFTIYSASIVYENGLEVQSPYNKQWNQISFKLSPNANHEALIPFDSIDGNAKPTLNVLVYHCHSADSAKAMVSGDLSGVKGDTVTIEI